MTDDYAKYEAACDKIRADNAVLQAEFTQWLESKGLSKPTIERHVSNVSVYTDIFLLYTEATKAAKGTGELEMFFGGWFIRKCLWATPTSMRSIAASLKKFYAFMHDSGRITADALAEVKNTVKFSLPDWLDALRRYDDVTDEEPWEL